MEMEMSKTFEVQGDNGNCFRFTRYAVDEVFNDLGFRYRVSVDNGKENGRVKLDLSQAQFDSFFEFLSFLDFVKDLDS